MIEFYTPQADVVNVPAQGQPPLANEGQYPAQGQPLLQPEQNTTFYLLVSEVIGKQTYSAQQNVPVTVEQPAPTIMSFTGQFERSGGQPVLVLNWETTHADYCQLTGIATELTTASPPGGYRIPATVTSPLLISYTLTANQRGGAGGKAVGSRVDGAAHLRLAKLAR